MCRVFHARKACFLPHFTGSLRFPSTKPRLSSKLCDCLHAVIFPLISVVLAYHPTFITIFACQAYPLLGTMYAWPGVQPDLRPDRENRLGPLGRTQMCSAQFHGENSESLTKRSTRLSRKESVESFSDRGGLPPVQIRSGGLCAIIRRIYARLPRSSGFSCNMLFRGICIMNFPEAVGGVSG